MLHNCECLRGVSSRVYGLAQVQYSALPNFEEREEDFRAESVILRRRFTDQGTQSTEPFCIQLHEPHVTDSTCVDNANPYNLEGVGTGHSVVQLFVG